MNFMNNKLLKFLHSPFLIVMLVFLLPPLGLILLGNHPRISIIAKISTGLIVGIFLLLFFFQYQWTPKLPSNNTNKAEQLKYEFIRLEYPEELKNSLDETVKPEGEQNFVKLFFSVENLGEKAIFYASLIDQPRLIGTEESYAPDLTLSKEPFGNLGSKHKAEGYLVFVVPLEATLQSFLIAGQEFALQP
jgi:hypothetical protein